MKKAEQRLTDYKPQPKTCWLQAGSWEKQGPYKRTHRTGWRHTGHIATQTVSKPTIFFKKIGHNLMKTSQLII